MTASYRPVPYAFERYGPDEMRRRARAWYAEMDRRRSVRQFSNEPVPRELIAEAIRTAGTAPSGAHMQPWTFVVVGDPALKAEIRLAAEAEERGLLRTARARRVARGGGAADRRVPHDQSCC